MTRTLAATAALVSITLLGSAAAAPSAIREAGIAQSGLIAGDAGGHLATIAQGGPGRGLPAISPDGGRIAFVQLTDKKIALAEIVVTGFGGREISRTQIEPVKTNIAYSGMQAVEALRWVSPGRIAVRGSINPSQSQYYVIEAATGKIVGDFTDDESAAAFSPDGLHVSALSDSPHFGRSDSQKPVLSIDDKPIWRGTSGASVAAAPRFSADGAALAWAVRDAAGRASLLLWSGNKLHHMAVSAAADATLGVYWSADRAVVTAAPTGVSGRTLAWSATAKDAVATGQLAANPEADAAALRARLVRTAASAGIREADFWCASCSLALLPRGTE